jgi:hypothetical protein
MTTDTVFLIGEPVHAWDGPVGKLVRLVVDPETRTLTHLAVEPAHRRPVRLVPLASVAASAGDVTLTCTVAEFDGFAHAEETRLEPAPGEGHVHRRRDILSAPPYHVLAAGRAMGPGIAEAVGDGPADGTVLVTRDVVPPGEEELCSGQHVEAADGEGGHLRGLIVDEDHQITGVIVELGHLPVRRAAVPAAVVTALGGTVEVSLTRDQLRALAEARGHAARVAERPGTRR